MGGERAKAFAASLTLVEAEVEACSDILASIGQQGRSVILSFFSFVIMKNIAVRLNYPERTERLKFIHHVALLSDGKCSPLLHQATQGSLSNRFPRPIDFI